MMLDVISVIVPIYNASEYLSQCIESILRQSYKALEVILIDDGSTDDSSVICKKYEKEDSRIRFISQKNGGSVIARKTGLKAANGKCIGFVDADDYIEPDMFEKLYLKIKEYDVDFVHSGMLLEYEKICNYQEMIIDFSLMDRGVYIRENIFEKQHMFFGLWSKLFKANIIKDAYMQLPDEQCYGEDLLCLCNYISKCNKFYMYKDAFYHYRIHETSLSHQNWLNICLEESKLHNYVIKFLFKNNLIETCGNSARVHYRRRITEAMVEDRSNGISAQRYNIKKIETLKGKKVALYGAGKVGKDFYSQIVQNGQCEVVAWADKENYGVSNLISICRPIALKGLEYDVIILAVKSKKVADEMRAELIRNDICKDDSLILWEEPICLW